MVPNPFVRQGAVRSAVQGPIGHIVIRPTAIGPRVRPGASGLFAIPRCLGVWVRNLLPVFGTRGAAPAKFLEAFEVPDPRSGTHWPCRNLPDRHWAPGQARGFGAVCVSRMRASLALKPVACVRDAGSRAGNNIRSLRSPGPRPGTNWPCRNPPDRDWAPGRARGFGAVCGPRMSDCASSSAARSGPAIQRSLGNSSLLRRARMDNLLKDHI